MNYFDNEQPNHSSNLEKNNFPEFERRYEDIFDNFGNSIKGILVDLDIETVNNFFTKYEIILNSFVEIKDKLIEKIKEKMTKKLVSPDFLESVLEDIEKILNDLLLKILKDNFGQNYDTRNALDENGNIFKTEMAGNQEENSDVHMTFNFMPQERSEARVAFSKTDQNGREMCLRFDLDESRKKVFCDFQSGNLDVLLENDHHLPMESLTNFVGFGEEETDHRENFKEFVGTFKNFLKDISESKQKYTLEDLMKKFNQ
jgi:hypothetical protein